MGRSHWDTPDDARLIEAKTAYYVLGTGLKGAMGVGWPRLPNRRRHRKSRRRGPSG
ncbi:nitrous oxide reductase accessory protein NosL [Pseudomonas fluorescens]|uniref:nitrous oxide reductase accessory protein NosL n=1 Tax=Pseudomonas fluorescens TaxID=294 RepID=UPI0002E9D10D